MRKWIVCAVAIASLSSAPVKPPSDRIQNRACLRQFFERLATHKGPVHVLQFGDSQTASDDWVDAMRVRFQNEFGHGGPGWVTAGHIRYYRRWDVKSESSPGWTVVGAIGHPGDGRVGLGGFSLEASRAGEWISIHSDSERLAVYFLKAPGAGSFTVDVDGDILGTVDANEEQGLGRYDVAVRPGMHRYTVRTVSGEKPVRVFGWAADNNSGVTWETLGINGAQASMILDWNQSLWKAQLAERNPALVVLAYGTNEAISPKWTSDGYRTSLSQLIALIHEAVPETAVLLLGPPDCGRLRPFPHLAQVVEIQKEIARVSGAAFWDWRSYMGGPGSDRRWVRSGLMQRDYTHFTGEGYRLVGTTLAAELEREAIAWTEKNGL